MPSTPNFNWTMPTVGGDTGAWGTILNTLFGDVDADLQTVWDSILAEADQERFISVALEGQLVSDSDPLAFTTTPFLRALSGNAGAYVSVTKTSGHQPTPTYWDVPLTDLKAGQILDGFETYGSCTQAGGTSLTMALYRTDQTNGAAVQIGATGSAPVSIGWFGTASALAHLVLTDTRYFVRYSPNGSNVSGILTTLRLQLDRP